MRWLWVSGLLVVLWACGNKNDHAPSIGVGVTSGGMSTTSLGGSTSTSGGGGKSGSGGRAQAGESAAGAGGDEIGAGGVGATSPLAPTVEITSPAAVSDPDQGEILVVDSVGSGSVDVTCTATQSSSSGSTAVDASTVKIAVLDASGMLLREVAGDSTGNPNEYSANFSLSTVAAGALSFRCSATDKSTPRHTATATISTFLDHGPTISVTSPAVNSAHPLKGAVHFEFSVVAAPLATGDQGAAVADVELRANGVNITSLTPDAKRPGVYTAEVDFTDAALFTSGLTGTIPISIDATDSRSPTPATQTKSYTFLLDGSGPTVTITNPPNKTIIGGQIQLSFTAVDEVGGSGVDPTKVVVLLDTVQYTYDPNDPAWSFVNGTFTFAFDSTKFDSSVSQVTVVAQATDLAGNGPTETKTSSAQMLLFLDNAPPFVSLATPDIRVISHPTTAITLCTEPFNPIGPAVVQDGATAMRFQMFRAFAWDRTNGVPSQDILYYSGIDPSLVKLYLQPDASKPLVIDTNGDGLCDAIAADVKTLPSLDLSPLPQMGVGNTNPPDFTTPPSVAGSCNATPSDEERLCAQHASDMTVVVIQNYGGVNAANTNAAAIYASSPGPPASLSCTGEQWDVASVTSGRLSASGWFCVAAEATDAAGNTGISAPLRICLDDETVPGSPPCATSSMPLPTCSDGCTPPSKSRDGDDAAGNPKPFTIEYK